MTERDRGRERERRGRKGEGRPGYQGSGQLIWSISGRVDGTHFPLHDSTGICQCGERKLLKESLKLLAKSNYWPSLEHFSWQSGSFLAQKVMCPFIQPVTGMEIQMVVPLPQGRVNSVS